MRTLEDAIGEIEQARRDVAHSDVRTELESITASLQQMLDTAAGDRTEGDVAFAESDIAGAAPNPDNLQELEDNLAKLAENADDAAVRDHLESARRRIQEYRTGHGEQSTG